MSLLLSDEQRAFQGLTERFARKHEADIDRALVCEMGDLGPTVPDALMPQDGLDIPYWHHRGARLWRFQTRFLQIRMARD